MFKSIELFFRRCLLLLLRGKNRSQSPKPILNNLPENTKILFLRHDKIGDVLITIPTIRILRHKFPNAQLDILLGTKNQAVASSVLNYCRQTLVYTKKPIEIFILLKRIRAERYDIIIDCIDNPSTTSRMIIRFSKVKYSVGLENTTSGIYTHSVALPDKATTHIVERTATLLHAFGIYPKPSDLDLEYIIPKQYSELAEIALGKKDKIRLGINIAAGWEKYWGRENFISLLHKLQSDELQIIGFATSEFQGELNAISTVTSLRNAPLASNFDEFAAMLSSCDVIFTPDTSVVHLSAAWKIPCLVLYSNIVENHMLWTPYHSPHRVVTTRHPMLSTISPQSVLIEVNELIAQLPKKV